MPSGLDADTGKPWEIAIKAQKTVSFACAKKGFSYQHSLAYTGEVIVADIGIPPQVVQEVLGA